MKTPMDILREWMQAVNDGDIEKLVALYHPSAILIPTFSNRILDTPEKIRSYFEKLGNRKELSIALHEKTLSVQDLKNDIFILNGIYNWRFLVDEEILNFEARFSYVLNLTEPAPIVHHHSSQIPRMI